MLKILVLGILLFCAQLGAQDCTEGGCHEDVMVKEYLHVPVEELDCEACHNRVKKKHPGGRGKEFELSEDNILDLCSSCHDVAEGNADLHSPVEDGECTTCHDPHQSNFSNMLRGETTADVCSNCHEIGTKKDPFIHGPVAVGACEVCHSGHDNSNGYLLLNETVNGTCFECHESKAEEISSYVFEHEPVVESCSNCHDPHSSQHKYQLTDDVPMLCLDCHDDIAEGLEDAETIHKAVNINESCMNCHAAHGSVINNNLKSPPFDLCLGCHNTTPKRNEPGLVNMKKLLDKNKDWHGPIRDKDCSGCHNPHSSSHFRLLKYDYPAKFYTEFDVKKYDLCYQCHPAENVFEKNVAILTNFRDGDTNLHYLHVHKKKGRTCRACHETHASKKPYHIREKVPFGKWMLPINFTPTDRGGSCLPGCHDEKIYERDKTN